jgi:hypothetical protein
MSAPAATSSSSGASASYLHLPSLRYAPSASGTAIVRTTLNTADGTYRNPIERPWNDTTNQLGGGGHPVRYEATFRAAYGGDGVALPLNARKLAVHLLSGTPANAKIGVDLKSECVVVGVCMPGTALAWAKQIGCASYVLLDAPLAQGAIESSIAPSVGWKKACDNRTARYNRLLGDGGDVLVKKRVVDANEWLLVQQMVDLALWLLDAVGNKKVCVVPVVGANHHAVVLLSWILCLLAPCGVGYMSVHSDLPCANEALRAVYGAFCRVGGGSLHPLCFMPGTFKDALEVYIHSISAGHRFRVKGKKGVPLHPWCYCPREVVDLTASSDVEEEEALLPPPVAKVEMPSPVFMEDVECEEDLVWPIVEEQLQPAPYSPLALSFYDFGQQQQEEPEAALSYFNTNY